MSTEPSSPIVRLMMNHAIKEFGRLQQSQDYDLVLLMMETLAAGGISAEGLSAFRAHHRNRSYGCFRDEEHYAGVTPAPRQLRMSWRQWGLVVHATGRFAGFWMFLLDFDGSILTSHDGEACESFAGLDGPALVAGVIASTVQ